MPRQYRTGFRDEMVRRMLAGELVSQLVSESKVPMQTLQLVKDASKIYDSMAVMDPKEGRCVAVELVSRGHGARGGPMGIAESGQHCGLSLD